VEIAGYAALMLATLLIGVQVVTWGLAALGARYAANQAAQAARGYRASAADGRAAAESILHSAVGSTLDGAQVAVTRDATTVTVTVTGTAVAILPGFTPTVTVTVHAPTEEP
jgi:hypothetical protein